MFKLKTLAALSLPACAHGGGGRHTAQAQTYYCGDCRQSHTGHCPAGSYRGGHHGGHHGR